MGRLILAVLIIFSFLFISCSKTDIQAPGKQKQETEMVSNPQDQKTMKEILQEINKKLNEEIPDDLEDEMPEDLEIHVVKRDSAGSSIIN